MWKKMGNVQPGALRSVRSHLSKDQEPFRPFKHEQLQLPTPDGSNNHHKTNFCEAYINRHHSADKPSPISHSRTRSSHSSLVPVSSTKLTPQPLNDIFTLLRTGDLVQRKSSLEKQTALPDKTLALQQQLKSYRDKWREARQKLLALKKKQGELKQHVSLQLGKWKQSVEQAVGELVSHAAIRREGVGTALEAARQFREQEQKWRREREGILSRFNTTLDRLI